jgi:hypothetical protein
MFGILAAGIAPLIVSPGVLMPVKKVLIPNMIEHDVAEYNAVRHILWSRPFDFNGLHKLLPSDKKTLTIVTLPDPITFWRNAVKV